MLKQFCHETSCHGVAKIYDAKSWPRRLFWISVLLASVGGFGVVSFRIMVGFLNSPVTNTFFAEKQQSMKIPDILFCLLGEYWNESKAERLGLNLDEIREYIRISASFQVLPDIAQERFLYLSEKLNYTHPLEFNDRLGPLVEEIFVDCSSNSHDPYPCSEVIRPAKVPNEHCYLARGLPPQRYPGFGSFTRFLIRLPAMKPVDNFDSYGIQLSIHDEYMGVSLDPLTFPGGSDGRIFLKAEEKRHINTLLRTSCNATLSRRLSEEECRVGTEVKRYHEECKCQVTIPSEIFRIPSLESDFKDDPICTPLQAKNCIYPIGMDMVQNPPKCLPSCSVLQFVKSVSTSTLNSPKSVDQVERYVRVTLAHTELKISVTQEVNTMTTESVIGNLGGALGVFLGSSLITLIEILDLTADICGLFRGSKKS